MTRPSSNLSTPPVKGRSFGLVTSVLICGAVVLILFGYFIHEDLGSGTTTIKTSSETASEEPIIKEYSPLKVNPKVDPKVDLMKGSSVADPDLVRKKKSKPPIKLEPPAEPEKRRPLKVDSMKNNLKRSSVPKLQLPEQKKLKLEINPKFNADKKLKFLLTNQNSFKYLPVINQELKTD